MAESKLMMLDPAEVEPVEANEDESKYIQMRNEILADLEQAQEKASPMGQVLIEKFEKQLLQQDQLTDINQKYVWDRLPLSQKQKEELIHAAMEANMRKEVLTQLVNIKPAKEQQP